MTPHDVDPSISGIGDLGKQVIFNTNSRCNAMQCNAMQYRKPSLKTYLNKYHKLMEK